MIEEFSVEHNDFTFGKEEIVFSPPENHWSKHIEYFYPIGSSPFEEDDVPRFPEIDSYKVGYNGLLCTAGTPIPIQDSGDYKVYNLSFPDVFNQHIQNIVLRTNIYKRDAKLTISSKTYFNSEYVKEALDSIRWNLKRSVWNGISFTFKLEDATPNAIEQIFRNIFKNLKNFNITTNISNVFYDFLFEYFKEHKSNFSSNYFQLYDFKLKGTPYPQQRTSLLKFQTPIKKLFKFDRALDKYDNLKLLTLLREGISPDATIMGGSLAKVVSSIDPSIFYEKSKIGDILNVIKLLITYGADPTLEDLGATAEEILIGKILQEPASCEETQRFMRETLCILMSVPGSNRSSNVHPRYENLLIGQLITIGNRFRIEERITKTSMHDVVLTLNSKANALMRIQAHDNKKIKIERRYATKGKSLEELLSHPEKTILFNLFKKKMQVDNKTAISEFSDCFKGPGHLLMDIVRYDSFLLGINVAEKIEEDQHGQPIIINGKEIVIYHIRLSITSAKYDRLMSLVSFIEPFALQQQDPNRVYYIVWEASSYDSVRQIDGQLKRFYPKHVVHEDVAIGIKDILYQSDDVINKNPIYVKDRLSRFKKQNRDLGFYQQMFSNNNADNFWNANKMINEDAFNVAFAQEGESPIIIFESNDENLEHFDKIISAKINRKTFKDLVKERAEQLNNSYTPTIRSNL